jgi:hypothetical protein
MFTILQALSLLNTISSNKPLFICKHAKQITLHAFASALLSPRPIVPPPTVSILDHRRHIRSSLQATGSPTRIKDTKESLRVCERARERACAREEIGRAVE